MIGSWKEHPRWLYNYEVFDLIIYHHYAGRIFMHNVTEMSRRAAEPSGFAR